MAPDKFTTEPTLPVQVTMIGTGAGNASLTGTIATTPGAAPNLLINVVPPLIAILVRFLYTFGGQVVGLLTAAMTPAGSKVLYTGDFVDLLQTCVSLSIPWTVLALLKDIVTVFKGLESKYPLLTGNV